MENVFWDSERVIHIDFLPRSVTFNTQCYSKSLHNHVHREIWKKRPRKMSEMIILLHGKFDEGNTGNSGLGRHEPLSLNTDIALSDFH
jgi:hypothetical protein